MKKYLLLFILCCFISTAYANTSDSIVTQTALLADSADNNSAAYGIIQMPDSTIKKTSDGMLFFYRMARIIESFLMKGIDSTYLGLYDHSWKLAFTNTETGIHSTMNLNDIWSYNRGIRYSEKIQINPAPSVGLGFAAAWHTIQFNYSWDVLYRRSSKLDLAILNRAWGIEFMRHVNTNVYGTLTDFSTNNGYEIEKGDMEFATSFVSAYFIFNSERYSTYSALRQSYIQKKSAGSFYLQAQYLGSHMTANDTELIKKMNDLENIEIHQAAVSAGYGYNYTPNQGKFLLHVSAAPMAILFNRTILTYLWEIPNDDGSTLYYRDNQIINPKHWFYITGTARMAFSWNINEWCYLAGNAQFYNLRFDSEKNEDMRMKINTWEWNATITFGARFGFSRKKMAKVLQQYDAYKAANPGKDDVIDWVEKLINKH